MFFIPITFAGLSILLGAKLGAKIAQVKIASTLINHGRGYRKGEGPFTELEAKSITIIAPAPQGNETGAALHTLTAAFPQLKKYAGRKFLLTKTEGKDLREMMIPVFQSCARYGSPDYMDAINATLTPVMSFLAAFPANRVR
jgi:hypothetical protein